MMDRQISGKMRQALSVCTDGSVSRFEHKDKSKEKNLWVLICLALALVALPVGLSAQTDAGAIVGTVVDNSGAALPNGTVTIVNLGTNQKTSRLGAPGFEGLLSRCSGAFEVIERTAIG